MRVVQKAVPRPVRRWLSRVLPEPALTLLGRPQPQPKPAEPPVRVEPDASPRSVRDANLHGVIAALDAAEVPWFRIPALRFEQSTIAVPDSHRSQAERVLAALAESGAVVLPVLPERPWTATSTRPGAALPPKKPAPAATAVARPAAGPVEAVTATSSEGPEEEPAPEPVATAVHWPVTDPSRRLLLGAQHACEVEFWQQLPDRLVAPRHNRSVEVVLNDEPEVEADESVFSDFRPAEPGARRYRTRRPFLLPPVDHIDFPIDVVYTWVDGADPAWLARKRAAVGENDWVSANELAANDSRFISRNELRYSLRSLHAYAPWVRKIFLVTDDQVPEWLNTDHPQITVVSHKKIFGTAGKLPTFNSMAIETRLHHIEGLSEHFIYFNDDVFIGQPLQPGFFFTPTGQSRFFFSTGRVDAGPPAADEPPVISAGKNNRALIEKEFGRFVAYKMKHTAHAARRSVLAEIEAKCPEAIARTAGHQFRHPDDIALLSSLQQHWAYLTGRAVVGDIQFMYRDLAEPSVRKRLTMTLRKRPYQIFCLNDTVAGEVPIEEQIELLNNFLPAYYPFRSPYERAEPSDTEPAAAVTSLADSVRPL